MKFYIGGWRGGAMVGRRIDDQEVANSITGQVAAAYDDSGQVVHTKLPRRRHYWLLYGVAELGNFTFINFISVDNDDVVPWVNAHLPSNALNIKTTWCFSSAM